MKRLTFVILAVAAFSIIAAPRADAQRHRGKSRSQRSASHQSHSNKSTQHRHSQQKHHRFNKSKHHGFQHHHGVQKSWRKTTTLPHQTVGRHGTDRPRPAVTMPKTTARKPRPKLPRPGVTMPHQTVNRPSVTMPLETSGRPRPATRPGHGPPRPRHDITVVQGTAPVYVPWAGNWRSGNRSSE